jgi:hypothetical protein
MSNESLMIALLAVFILGPAFHVAAVVLDVVIRLLEREP